MGVFPSRLPDVGHVSCAGVVFHLWEENPRLEQVQSYGEEAVKSRDGAYL